MNKKQEITFMSVPYNERMKIYNEQKKGATEKAMNSEKIHYKSTNDPERFKEFLEKRLELWDSLKSKVIENGRLKKGFTNRYHEKMYDKTNEIIQNLPC
jgi:phosphoserine phosphatase